ncbi:hypothetical protein BGX27_009893 [Mortierella sp. AM989]|nr:hypothetical protein BGX27_009893 [Mortierella sp. AM989]
MPSSISTPSLLQFISNEDASSSYLAELVDHLPLAASQFGLVLHTALELRDNSGKLHSKDPGQAGLNSALEQPHYRSKAMPTSGSEVDFTNIDVTMSGKVTSLYARCEAFLMRAAATAANTKSSATASTSSELSAKELVERASSENFVKALNNLDDPKIQEHYQNFLSFVPTVIEHWVAERTRIGEEATGVGCYCINDIWRQPLASLADNRLDIWTRAVKFVINEEDLLKTEPEIRARCKQLEEEQGLVLEPMVEGDINLMIKLNKISFDEDYGKFIIKRSLCFRNKNGDMVAWAGTHGDFSIAALHVLPEYRKAGLGRLVLNSLALIHVRLARSILTSFGGKDNDSISPSSLFAHADCVDDNHPTMAFMERCGWSSVGNYLWFELPCNTSAKANQN